MKLLHTSDWHVGKTLRGRSRIEEHRAVLAEIASIAAAESVDVVLITGDLFDTSAPGPDAERVCWQALLDLEATGAQVVAIAGNHDSERRLEAVEPLLRRGGRITLRPSVTLAADGAVVDVRTAAGEDVQIACVPFMSQRNAVRANKLMSLDASAQVQAYAATFEAVVRNVITGFRPGAVHIAAAHAFVQGATVGGSERVAHTALGYAVSHAIFPSSTHYVALGHLHRAQPVGRDTVRYAGAPLQLDFGEAGHGCSVTIVEATASTPARVKEIPLTSGRPLVEVRGTLAQLAIDAASVPPDAHVKVRAVAAARVGLADEVRSLFAPGAVIDVLVERPDGEGVATGTAERRIGRTPAELLASYLDDRNARDPAVEALFAELLEDASHAS